MWWVCYCCFCCCWRCWLFLWFYGIQNEIARMMMIFLRSVFVRRLAGTKNVTRQRESERRKRRKEKKNEENSFVYGIGFGFYFCIHTSNISFLLRDMYSENRNTYEPIKQQVNISFFLSFFLLFFWIFQFLLPMCLNLFEALIANVVMYKLQRTNVFMILPFVCQSELRTNIFVMKCQHQFINIADGQIDWL